MSRYDRSDERSDYRRRGPRTERDYYEDDIDIRSRYDGPAPSRRAETAVREKDETVVSGRRAERGPRQPDFLRDDYGKSSQAGELVVRERREEREDDYVSRAPTRRRSLESVRSRPPPARSEVDKEEFIFRERDRDNRGPPYPRSERGSFTEKDEMITRTRTRSRPPASRVGERSEEKIDIRIHEDDTKSEWRPPRREYKEQDVDEIRFRRGGGGPPPPRTEIEKEEITFTERSRPPPARTEVDKEEIIFRESRRSPPPREVEKEEIIFRESRSPPPREPYRGREVRKEEIDIDINIRDRSAPPPRERSMSRGPLVGRVNEEWIVRKRRSPSPPPPRDFEKEQIIIRRKERTPSPEPEPPRELTPEPPPPPEPIYRPPIIQEVITHHRHIDHGVERAREATPPPPPFATNSAKGRTISRLRSGAKARATERPTKMILSSTRRPESVNLGEKSTGR